MQLSEIFLGLGQESFDQCLRVISLGRLKTFQLFDPLKTRLHLHKLNGETLRKSAPRLWERLSAHDSASELLATELSQAILICHLDMIKAVLDGLKVPHEEGFFAKDTDISGYLTPGWQQKAWDQFQAVYPPAALLFYINHLGWEVLKTEGVFEPGKPAPAQAAPPQTIQEASEVVEATPEAVPPPSPAKSKKADDSSQLSFDL